LCRRILAVSFTGRSSSPGESPRGRDREDEAALPEAHPADHDRIVGAGQDDHVADIDVTGQDHILHKRDDTGREDQPHPKLTGCI
jgi:hypothetical protein